MIHVALSLRCAANLCKRTVQICQFFKMRYTLDEYLQQNIQVLPNVEDAHICYQFNGKAVHKREIIFMRHPIVEVIYETAVTRPTL